MKDELKKKMNRAVLKKKASFESNSTAHSEELSPLDNGGGKKYSLTTDEMNTEEVDHENLKDHGKEPRKRTRNSKPLILEKEPAKYCKKITKYKRPMSPKREDVLKETLIKHFVLSKLNREQT